MLLSDQRLTVCHLYQFLIAGNWLTVGNSESAPSEEAFTEELVQCIRTVAEDRPWLNSALVDAAIERETGRRSASQYVTGSLTSRERQVTLLVADGLSNKEVGRRLGLSEGTVKIHLHNIYQKLNVNNRTALAALAITHREWPEHCNRDNGKIGRNSADILFAAKELSNLDEDQTSV